MTQLQPSSEPLPPTPGRHYLYDRPLGVFAILLAVLVLGGLLVPRLPVDIWPSFRSQSLFVRVQIEDSTVAETLEQVTRPMEGLLRGINGIEHITSRTRDSFVFLVITPSDDASPSDLLAAVTDTVAANSHRFPSEMTFRVGSWSNEDTPPIAFAIGGGGLSAAAFENLIEERIIPALSSIDGVAAATQGDYDPGAVQIFIERTRAQAQGINPQQVATQLGALEPVSLAYTTRDSSGRSDTVVHLRLDDAQADHLERLPVAANTPLGSLALVHRSQPGADRIVLVNGKPGAVISVYRSPEANGYQVSRQAEATMRALARNHDLDLIVPTATHRTINAAAGELLQSGLWGAACAFLFLLIFLRQWRLTILVCLAIPCSLALAVIGLAINGTPINIFTMVGFLLALGMLVDNSVVVGEALSRAPGSTQPREQRRLRHRAVGGVSMAIVLSTLTTIAIILPFQFLDVGPLSAPVNAIALPVVWSLLGSLCVALVLTPIIFSWWYQRASRRQHSRPRWLRWGERIYGRVLVLLFRQPALAVLLLLTVIAVPTVMVLQHPAGMSMNANLETDERRAVLPIVQRSGVPLERFQEVAAAWHQQLTPHLPALGATGVVTEIGGRRSELHIYLHPIDDGLSSDDVADRVADILEPHLDLALNAHLERARGDAASSGPRRWNRHSAAGNHSRLTFMLRHPHAEALPEAWLALRPAIEAIPGVNWVSPPFEPPEPSIEFALSSQAFDAGFRPQNIGWQINRLTGRRTVASLADGTAITMGPLRQQNPTLGEILAMTVSSGGSASDSSQRFDALTEMGMVQGSSQINRSNGMSEERISIGIDSERRSQIMATILDPRFPIQAGAGEQLSVGLTWWLERAEASKFGMTLAVILACLTVFLIMAFFYESVIAPFAALSSVPLALAVVIAWLGWRGEDTGAMAYIGCFFLVGIVVNNGIVLVDRLRRTVAPTRCSNELRVARALAASARRRLGPILLTSLTTISATVPMALGSARIAGMPISELGATVAVGLSGATVLTLLVVPLAYYWLARLRRGVMPSAAAQPLTSRPRVFTP